MRIRRAGLAGASTIAVEGGGNVTTPASDRDARIPAACLPSDQVFDTWIITAVS